ncbi:MAG: nuclease-related domain-containing protein [Armatimonadetes bacterium]|nr:nuclease-related domain-containing protein [Armatimonadota bacterium]
MHVVRYRSLTQLMAVGTLVVLGVGVLVFVLTRGLIAGTGWSWLLPIGALIVGLKALDWHWSWVKGWVGERALLHSLRTLGDGWTAVTNFVPRDEQRGDVDLILVGPPGVLVVEAKTYSGVIVHDRGAWHRVQSNGWRTRIPKGISGQALGNRDAVDRYIRSSLGPDCPISLTVMPLLVFIGADEVNPGRTRVTALQSGRVTEHISGLPPVLRADEVARVAAVFGSGSSAE